MFKDIIEGQIYILENFKVKDFLGDETYRPVRNEKHIYFTRNTKATKDENGGLEIEKFSCDTFHMADIEKVANDNRFLIGKVTLLNFFFLIL